MKRSLFLFFVLALITVLSFSVIAASYPDIKGHWAEGAIERLADEEIVKGYTDGTFKTEKFLTRAEFISFIARIFEPQNSADLSKYSDLDKNAWYYEAFGKVFTAKAIEGSSSTKMNPDDYITRQEAVCIFNRILELKANSGDTLNFTDSGDIADWAKDDVLAFSSRKYVIGYEDGSFRPNNYITRAECIKLLSNVIGKIIRKSGTYDLTGVKGIVVVLADNVTLKNDKEVERVFVLNDEYKKNLKFDDNTVRSDKYISVIDELSNRPSPSERRSSGGGSSSKKEQKLIITLTTQSGDASGDIYDIKKEGTVKDGVKITVIVDGETLVDNVEFSSTSFADLKVKQLTAARKNIKNKKVDSERLLRTAYVKYYKNEDVMALINEFAEKEGITSGERATIRSMRKQYIAGTKTGKELYKELTQEQKDRLLDAYTDLDFDTAKRALELL